MSVHLIESPKQGNLQKCSRVCSWECSQKSGCCQECSRENRKSTLESTPGSTREHPDFIYTEQMDAEGLGRKLLLTSLVAPAESLKSRPWVLSQNANPVSTFELSRCRHCKEGLPGPMRGFWVPSGSLSPKTAASICSVWISESTPESTLGSTSGGFPVFGSLASRQTLNPRYLHHATCARRECTWR